LTYEVAVKILYDLLPLLEEKNVKMFFGGTSKLAEYAKKTKKFIYVFEGDEQFQEILSVLELIKSIGSKIRKNHEIKNSINNRNIIERLKHLTKISDDGYFIPLIRHHFGLPSFENTVKGIERISKSKLVDIISLAPDQNAQQFFFRPEKMNPAFNGSGGIPLRKPEDLLEIKKAALFGNHPFLRIYSGTYDLIKWAELSQQTINNAWGAIPIFWYSELDGRSDRMLIEAIKENQNVIKWYSAKNLPIEILEAHQWSLRDAPDSVSIASAYIGAYNARFFGIKNLISQFMLNNPRFTSPIHDLAKLSAQLVLIETLCSEDFYQWREVRPGLSHFSSDLNIAKGQLAMSISYSLALHPHIIHVVSFTEGDHATTDKELIESCKIVIGVLKNSFLGIPNLLNDERIIIKRKKLQEEALVILGTIFNMGKIMNIEEPFVDPKTLSLAIELGILDAPHLKGKKCAAGIVNTFPFEGGCHSFIDGKPIMEKDRLNIILKSSKAKKILGRNSTDIIDTYNISNNILYNKQKLLGFIDE
jgi:hypothetical protein